MKEEKGREREKMSGRKNEIGVNGIKVANRAKKKSGRERNRKKQTPVRCRVTSTMNNTKVVRTWYDTKKGKRVNLVKTAGSIGYNNAKRGTVYAAQEVRGEVAKAYGVENRPNRIHVLRRGIGRGRAVALKELEKGGFKILTVSDATKDAHNGCRRKKQRRV